MEIVAVLGAGTYLAESLYRYNLQQRPVMPTKEEEFELMLETPREFILHQARESGIVAPAFSTVAARRPWSESNPPYYVYGSDINEPMSNPTEKVYQLYANSLEHYRIDTEEEIERGRLHFSRKRGQAIWNAFTREITVPGYKDQPPRTTDHQGWMWMPPTPTDTDHNEAGAMGKMMPPDPLLFTPDAYYMTNSGVSWRNGGTGY